MKISKFGAPAALLTVAALTLSACAANEPATPSSTGSASGSMAALSGTLAGKGASSMKAAQEKWVADFQTANPGVTVNYAPEGSGAGREAFIAGAVQFAGSDRPLKDEEMGKGKFAKCSAESNALNLPVYISPIAVVYNLDGVDELKLDADTVASIFAGKITKWNDPKIVATNPGVTLPDAAINAVHRADDSGTTNNFTDYLSKAAPSIWTEKASDKWPAAYKGEAGDKTAGVINAVKSGKNTIGYADESATEGMKLASLKVGDEFLKPTAEAAAKTVEQSKAVEGRAENDLALKLDRTLPGTYPAVLVSYAIVCEQYKDAKDAELVKAYIGYITSAEGQKSSAAVAKNAPLSEALGAKVKAAVDSIK